MKREGFCEIFGFRIGVIRKCQQSIFIQKFVNCMHWSCFNKEYKYKKVSREFTWSFACTCKINPKSFTYTVLQVFWTYTHLCGIWNEKIFLFSLFCVRKFRNLFHPLLPPSRHIRLSKALFLDVSTVCHDPQTGV